MLVLISVAAVAPLLACFWLGVFWQRKLLARSGHSIGKHFASAAALSFLPLAPLVLLLAALSTAVYYDGNCYGFTSGKRPCTMGEFALSQVFWASLIMVPTGIGYAAAVFLLFLSGWLGRPGQRS